MPSAIIKPIISFYIKRNQQDGNKLFLSGYYFETEEKSPLREPPINGIPYKKHDK